MVLAVLVALIGFFIPSANASSTPPWEPDPQSLGTVTFYDASGAVVTSGSDLSNLFAYAAASNNNGPEGTTKAYVTFAWPHSGQVTGNWFTAPASLATRYPATTAPSPVNGLTNPVVTAIGSGASNYAGVSGLSTFDTTSGYNDMIQVRLGSVGGPNEPSGDPTIYWASDIMINPSAGTWAQVYPAPSAGPTTTTTAVTATPASPQPTTATGIKFTASVTPSTATGSVQFFDGDAPLGAASAVSAGKASLTTTGTALGAGSHSIKAVFTPTSSVSFTASTSPAITYVIAAPAVTTTTSLSASPTSPISSGQATTLTATVTPSNAAGTVQIFDGSTAVGSAVAVTGGTAVAPAHTYAVGTHQLKAVFTPTSAAAFTTSTSAVITYIVQTKPATSTTTALTVTPAGPQVFGASTTLAATVTPSTAVGSVQFLDGSTVLGTVTASSGAAQLKISTLAAGTHSLTAKFVPTTPADFGTSTSGPKSYTVTKAASTVALTASPAHTAVQGSTVALTATTGPSGQAGTVQFSYTTTGDPINIGAPVTVTSNVAHLSTSKLPLTTTTISAVFTPTSANYSASPTSTIEYAVTPPPPGTTTTALAVTPATQATVGTTETLKATVTPATAAGTIVFKDGGTAIGSPVALASGTASVKTALALGTHSLTAQFVPTDSTKFAGSTSTAVSYKVLPPPTKTVATVTVSPGTTEPYGTTLKFSAKVTPAAAGSIAFKNGTTTLGTVKATVGTSSSTATLSTILGGGTAHLTVVFTPTAPLSFTSSTSASTTLTIKAVATTSSVKVSPTGSIRQGVKVTFTDTVKPSNAPGKVTFYSGKTALGTVTVAKGVATFSTTKLPVGKASITAKFTATHSNDFASSTSKAVTVSIVAAPKATSAAVGATSLASGGSVAAGSVVTVDGSGFLPGELVTVLLHSAEIKIGTVHASATGLVIANVLLPASLPLGKHTIILQGSVGSAEFPIVVTAAPSTVVTVAHSGAAGPGTTSSTGSTLAETGVDVRFEGIAALLLLVSGTMLMVGSRPRRSEARR
ncbi:MAG: Ig-like domain repeat protein [Jatrophihabitans sp.]|nr:Ig-like domain repeat protein [Jatrophihabitans sp.]